MNRKQRELTIYALLAFVLIGIALWIQACRPSQPSAAPANPPAAISPVPTPPESPAVTSPAPTPQESAPPPESPTVTSPAPTLEESGPTPEESPPTLEESGPTPEESVPTPQGRWHRAAAAVAYAAVRQVGNAIGYVKRYSQPVTPLARLGHSERERFDKLQTEAQREAFFLCRSFAQLKSEFPLSQASLADRLTLT